MSLSIFRKRLHFTSTAWFVLCVGYLLIFSLLDAGVHWWILFSLSGYGLLVLLILISLYLFAIFRGISSSQAVRIEHPLTSTNCYMYFYNLSPFLGGLAGLLGMLGITETPARFFVGVAMGTLVMTFMIWVVVDPAVGVLETAFSPAGRKHRAERLAAAAEAVRARQERHEQLLAEVVTSEQQDVDRWRRELRPQAQRLAELLTADHISADQAESEAIAIGVIAWQMGGMACMQLLREMALELACDIRTGAGASDYVSFWWDGIGAWQRPLIRDLPRV